MLSNYNSMAERDNCRVRSTKTRTTKHDPLCLYALEYSSSTVRVRLDRNQCCEATESVPKKVLFYHVSLRLGFRV